MRLIEATHLARVLDVIDGIAADVWLIDAVPAEGGRVHLGDEGDGILRQHLCPERVFERAVSLHEHFDAKERAENRDQKYRDRNRRNAADEIRDPSLARIRH